MSTTVTYATTATNQVIHGQSQAYWGITNPSPNNFYAINIIVKGAGQINVVSGNLNGDFTFNVTNLSTTDVTYDVVLMTVSNDGLTADNHTTTQIK